MKLSAFLVVSSCHASTTLLHQKRHFLDRSGNVDNGEDTDNDRTDPTDFHLLSFRQFGVATNFPNAANSTNTPSFRPTVGASATDVTGSAVPTYGETMTIGSNSTMPPTPAVPNRTLSPTPFGTPTVYSVQSLSPTLVDVGGSDAPTYGATPTVGTNTTSSPTPSAPIRTDSPTFRRTPLTDGQYERCKLDLDAADDNRDAFLNYDEYLEFVTANAASNGYRMHGTALGGLPYEYAMAFHTASCLCAYLGEGPGCCSGEKEGVHIYFPVSGGGGGGGNDTDVDGGQSSTGGGNSTTIDVGGGETDDYGYGAVVDTDTDVDGGQSSTGGGNSTTIDVGGGETDDSGSGAVVDTGISNGTKWRVLGTARDIFGDVKIVGGLNIFGDDAAENNTANGATGMEAFLNQESYTRNFCTDVYYAYRVTKAPTYAPTTYPPTIVEVTAAPTASSSDTITSAPNETVPTTAAPIYGTEPVTPTYHPTGNTGSPVVGGSSSAPVAAPTTAPPVGQPSGPPNLFSSFPTGLSGVATSSPTHGATSTSSSASTTLTTGSTSATSSIAPTTASSSSSDGNIHPVLLEYGISSNCGITAVDVLYAIDNTIMEGLVAATEVLVVDILNSTFPRDGTRSGHKLFHGFKTYAEMYAGAGEDNGADEAGAEIELTHYFIVNNLEMMQKQGADSYAEMYGTRENESEETEVIDMNTGSYLEMVQAQNSAETKKSNGHNTQKRKKKKKHHKKKSLKSNDKNDRKLPSLRSASPNHRNLVYWTPANPIVITNVEDVVDQTCPTDVNCMKVSSTVEVVLEEGDDAEAVEKAIRDGVAAAFTDSSFFQAIPPETIFCPGDTAPPFTSTNPPASGTSVPVSSPVTSQPTAGSTIAETESASSPASVSSVSTFVPTAAAVVTNKPTPAVASSNVPSVGSTDIPETTASPAAGEAVSTSQPSSGLTNATTTIAPSAGSTDIPETTASTAAGEAVSTSQPSPGLTNATTTTAPSPDSAVDSTVSPTATQTTTNTPVDDSNVPDWALPENTDSPTAEGGSAPSVMPATTPTEGTGSATSSPASASSSAPATTPTGGTGTATSSPASLSSSASPAGGAVSGGNLAVKITYDIGNDCGLDSEAIMNGVNNTLKTGLIAATTTTAIDVLNQTFPRTDNVGSKIRRVRTTRHLERRSFNLRHSGDRNLVQLKPLRQSSIHRNLVYYTDEFPVTIDRIIDNTEDCPSGKNCLLVVSTITTVLESGDDPNEVKKALEDGIRESFNTASFYSAIPDDTVTCPGDRKKRKKGYSKERSITHAKMRQGGSR